MRPIYGLLELTVRELWAKRIVLGLFVVSTLVLIVVTFALNLEVVEGSLRGFRLFGEESAAPPEGPSGPQEKMSLTAVVVAAEAIVAGTVYWIGILLSLFATSGLFATLQAPGRVELLLSKPLSRLEALLGHVLGVWTAVGTLIVYLMGGTWLIMSLKSGVWNPRFLLSIVIVIGMFGAMYAAVLLMSTLTESTALTLIVAYGLIFVSLVLAGAQDITPHLGPLGTSLFWGVYYLLPNFAEVTTTVTALAKGTHVGAWTPLASSLLFGGATYALSAYVFVRRDF
jgi:ABC-type transport system involved in multi-copper enzyme maturation permease subunit